MLDKYFDFKKREEEIYQDWERAGVFKLENQKGEGTVFNMTLPPPNANGELHIGHCYGYTVMDILARFHRSVGDKVLLVPGKDHAGIQTQVVFERKLREEGVDVSQMPRAEFWQKCYDFCLDRSSYMRGQEKLIGLSADFSKEIFTLSPGVSKIVYETFVKLWEEGLVYKGTRIVNWSVYSQTSISDVEVEYKEEKGHLWHIKYPFNQLVEPVVRRQINLLEIGGELTLNAGNHQVIIFDGTAGAVGNSNLAEDLKIGDSIVQILENDGVEIKRDWVIFGLKKTTFVSMEEKDLNKYNEQIRQKLSDLTAEFWLIDLVPELDQTEAVVVATTRPETMLGDAAVAVNPADPRYAHLIGKEVLIPIQNRAIKIIADDRMDIGFGTGAVKITPAHDFLDYQVGKDHQLEEIQVINKFGKMTDLAGGKYIEMKSTDCREELVKDLQAQGYLLLTEEIMHKVPIAERGKDIIEPLISSQWFVAVDKPGNSLRQRALDLINSGRVAVHPAKMKDQISQWLENLQDWNISRQILWGHQMPVWYRNKDQSNEEVFVGIDAPGGDLETALGEGWIQETDTFDTWFSSGQWPYSTLGSLNLLDLENPTNSSHFPTHTMVMGRDILLFWACRMMLLSTFKLNDIPWKNIYFTGLIRDAKGQKMSKSKNNGVEPKEILSKYGADAVRLGLIAGSSAGQDIKYDEKKIETFGKFANKIWNAAKLVAMKGEGDFQLKLPVAVSLKLSSTAWILNELAVTQKEFTRRLNNYEISNAFETIYHFSWDIFCSWYLEIVKIELEAASERTEEIKSALLTVFLEILKMLHCYMPFVTEEIYLGMDKFGGESLLAELQFGDFGTFGNETLEMKESLATMQRLMDIITAAREVRKVLEKPFSDRLTIEFEGSIDDSHKKILDKMVNADLAEVMIGITKPYKSGKVKVAASIEEQKKFKENLEKTLVKKEQEFAILERILTPGFKAKADPDLVTERVSQFEQIKMEIVDLKEELKFN